MPKKTENQFLFSLENVELGKKLESLNPKIKLEAEREAMLSRRSNHDFCTILKKSKFTEKIECVLVPRGKFFTTYKKLSEVWNCTKDQTRYQLKKWKQSGKITIKIIKDQKGFDLGLLITYNWLFNQQQESRQKKRAKIPTRGKPKKAHKIQGKKFLSSKIPTHNKEVLNKFNIHKKDDVFFGKTEKEKNQIREIKKDFAEIKLNPKLGNKFLELYDLALILDYLRLLKLNGERVKNKAGWLVNALKQNYDLQKVETWKDEQKELKKRQEAEKRAELEAIKLQEERQKEQQEQEQLIEKWRLENGEEQEENLYFEALEDFKKSNGIIYSCLMRKKPKDQDLLDYLKADVFVKSKVRGWILEEAKTSFKVLL